MRPVHEQADGPIFCLQVSGIKSSARVKKGEKKNYHGNNSQNSVT
jgi:hypothetical protein